MVKIKIIELNGLSDKFVEIKKNPVIEDLINAIYDKYSINVKYIIFNKQKCTEKDRTLESYGITNESFVIMMSDRSKSATQVAIPDIDKQQSTTEVAPDNQESISELDEDQHASEESEQDASDESEQDASDESEQDEDNDSEQDEDEESEQDEDSDSDDQETDYYYYSSSLFKKILSHSPMILIHVLNHFAQEDPFILSHIATNKNNVIKIFENIIKIHKSDEELHSIIELAISEITSESDSKEEVSESDSKEEVTESEIAPNQYEIDIQNVTTIMRAVDIENGESNFNRIKDLYLLMDRNIDNTINVLLNR